MQLLPVIIIFSLCFYHVNLKKSEQKWSKYKTELDKIGFGIEDFIFDIAEEVFKNANRYMNFDYDSDYENSEENASNANNEIKKEQANSFEMNNAIRKEAERSELDSMIENIRKRRRRAVEASSNPQVPVSQNPAASKTPDCLKTEKHVEEIKTELKRLSELVTVLQDQQTIISLLEQQPKGSSNSINQFDPKVLLKVLEHINNELNHEDEKSKELPTHKELQWLIFDLKQAISKLNKTKDESSEDRNKEKALKDELIKQRNEIDLLKSLVKKLLPKDANVELIPNNANPKEPENDKLPNTETKHTGKQSDEVVGLPLFLPKDFPSLNGFKANRMENLQPDENKRQAAQIDQTKANTNKLEDKENKAKDELNPTLKNKSQEKANKDYELNQKTSDSQKGNIQFLDEKAKTEIQTPLDNSQTSNKKPNEEHTIVSDPERDVSKILDETKGMDGEFKDEEKELKHNEKLSQDHISGSDMRAQLNELEADFSRLLNADRKNENPLIEDSAAVGDLERTKYRHENIQGQVRSKFSNSVFNKLQNQEKEGRIIDRKEDFLEDTKEHLPEFQMRPREKDSDEDLSKLLDEMEHPKKTDLKLKIQDLEDKLEKQSQLETLRKELSALRRKMEQNSGSDVIQSEDIELLKKLQLMINKSIPKDKLEGKSDDVEDELHKLEHAINKLQPKDDKKSPDLEIKDKLKPVSNKNGTIQLSIEQILDLRKKLDEIINHETQKDKISFRDDSSQTTNSKVTPPPYPFWFNGLPYPDPIPPPPFDYSYYPNQFYPPAVPYMPQGPYGSDYRPSFEDGYGPMAYPQTPPYPNPDVKNQFFQAPQSSLKDKPLDEVQYNGKGKNIANPILKGKWDQVPFKNQNNKRVCTDHFNVEAYDENLKLKPTAVALFGGPNGYPPQQTGNYPSAGKYIDPKAKNIQNLKMEISSLQNVINNMNRPPNKVNVKDKETINQLEREINRLQITISSLNKDMDVTPFYHEYTSNPSFRPPSNQKPIPTRHKRSAESGSENKVSSRVTKEVSPEDAKFYDDLSSKLREYLFEDDKVARSSDYTNIRNGENEITKENNSAKEDETARIAEFNDIRDRINSLKSQLGQPSPMPDYGNHNLLEPLTRQNTEQKGTDIIVKAPFGGLAPLGGLDQKNDFVFRDIILKVVDKIVLALPHIMGKLFGYGVESMIEKVQYDGDNYGNGNQYGGMKGKPNGNIYGNEYDSQNNYGNEYGVSQNSDSNSLMSIFYSLGTFGYIPLIILKIVKACSAFITLLKQNKFFRDFIVPTIVLLIVSGSVIFVIWWFKSDEGNGTVKQIDFHNRNSEDFNNNRNYYEKYMRGYTGTDYRANKNMYYPYPLSFYRNHYYYNKNNPKVSDQTTDRTVNDYSNVAPGEYFRTYFDDGSKKKEEEQSK